MLIKGRYLLRNANTPADLKAAQALRTLCFDQPAPGDADQFDAPSLHMLVEARACGTLVCCFRLLPLNGADLDQSYAAQFYDLSALQHYPGLMMEMGRFCVHPNWQDPDILRMAWAAMTDQVDQRGVKMLFGCSSFEGVDPHVFLDAFALLKAQHLAPPDWRPQIKAPNVFSFDDRAVPSPDRVKALRQMPPLLRTYLLMGGWVSDHAVIDPQMNTLHVFTGLEIAAIPEPRKRLLRALV